MLVFLLISPELTGESWVALIWILVHPGSIPRFANKNLLTYHIL